MATRVYIGPDPGELRATIRLQDRQLAAGVSPAVDESFVTVATVRAKVRAIAGGMILDGVQTEEIATHRFIIRHRSDRASWDWIEFDGRGFRVRSVRDPDEQKKWLEILAEEITP